VDHETWLYARRPGYDFGSELNGWAPVWKTDKHWANAAYVRHDPTMGPLSLGFEAQSILRPTCSWRDFELEIESLVRENSSILNLVLRPENFGVRGQIWKTLEVGELRPRFSEADLRGRHTPQPAWISTRICCLSIAAELCRMIAGGEPVMQTARDILQTDLAGRRLVSECDFLSLKICGNSLRRRRKPRRISQRSH
jgi:hypothetical protein